MPMVVVVIGGGRSCCWWLWVCGCIWLGLFWVSSFAVVVVVVVLWVFGGCWVDLALLLVCVRFLLCFELILF